MVSVSKVLIPFGMLHHPTDVDAQLLSPLHAALILLLLGTAYGFAHMVLRLGIARPSVLGGAMLFGFSVETNLMAGLVNGFAVPGLAAGDSADQIRTLWEINQALVAFAAVSGGAAILLWGIAFWTATGMLARVIAVSAVLLGAVPAVFVGAGIIRMDVQGALLAYGSHAICGALVGFRRLARRRT
jgi:hypothetical protein